MKTTEDIAETRVRVEQKYNLALVRKTKDHAWRSAVKNARAILKKTGDFSAAHSAAIGCYEALGDILTEQTRSELAYQAALAAR